MGQGESVTNSACSSSRRRRKGEKSLRPKTINLAIQTRREKKICRKYEKREKENVTEQKQGTGRNSHAGAMYVAGGRVL